MGKKIYQEDSEGGIEFSSERRSGEVRVPNYVYDLWMPLIGVEGIGVYSVCCRLEREGTVKGMSLQNMADACRVGKRRLLNILDTLEKLGFIKLRKPQGHERLMHYSTAITVLDPPQAIPQEVIDEYQAPKGYEPLTPWLVSPSCQMEPPTDPNDTTLNVPNGTAKIASSILHPSNVTESGASATAPPDELSWDTAIETARAIHDELDKRTDEGFDEPAPAQECQDDQQGQEGQAPQRDTTNASAQETTFPSESSGRTPPVPAPPPKRKRTAQDDMFDAVAWVLHAIEPGDSAALSLLQVGHKANISRTAKRLRGAGKLPDDLREWWKWWRANDWRGKQGERPTPGQLTGTWAEFEQSRNGAQNGQPKANYTGEACRDGENPSVGGWLVVTDESLAAARAAGVL